MKNGDHITQNYVTTTEKWHSPNAPMVVVDSDMFLLFPLILFATSTTTSIQMVAMTIMITAALVTVASMIRFPKGYCNVPSQ